MDTCTHINTHNIMVDVVIIVLAASAVNVLEFVMLTSYAVDVLVDVSIDAFTAVYSDDATIITASRIGGDMLADVDASVLADVMAGLKCIVPAPVADSVTFCC